MKACYYGQRQKGSETMSPVLVAVALGVLVGHLNLLPMTAKIIGKFTTGCLFIMLLAMGTQLGANDKLFSLLLSAWKHSKRYYHNCR